MIHKRSRKYFMNKKAAGDTLKNVLAACNKDSENINFDLLILKGIAQTNWVDTCKWIAIGFLFLILLTPVILINNNIKIESKGIATERIIIRNHQLYNDHFILELAGDDIIYNEIYARNSDGDVIFPISFDNNTGLVKFPYNNETLTIYIPDAHGHTLSVSLSAYSANDKENKE
ncbi:MAG: hypothetical protein K6E98_12515 [Lachnospiraceae bacterium]|nr:hypothetical protein [Lachnospiraceae bacterium]